MPVCECVSGGLTGLNQVEELCAIFSAGQPWHPAACVCNCMSAWSDSPAVWVILPHTHICTQTYMLDTNRYKYTNKHSLFPPTRHMRTVHRVSATLVPCVLKDRKTILYNLQRSFFPQFHFNINSAAVMKNICCMWGQIRGQTLFRNAFALSLLCCTLHVLHLPHSPFLLDLIKSY